LSSQRQKVGSKDSCDDELPYAERTRSRLFTKAIYVLLGDPMSIVTSSGILTGGEGIWWVIVLGWHAGLVDTKWTLCSWRLINNNAGVRKQPRFIKGYGMVTNNTLAGCSRKDEVVGDHTKNDLAKKR
jgi:hypothetical protein